MKVTGLITEYNPFHNGHAYHLERAREITGADYVVAVMSGNFVQRGGPAVINKYVRANMALACGADLVLELPVCYACSSAEYFAAGAVSLLNLLGITDSLCFGSECGDLSLLSETADILVREPLPFQEALRIGLKKGLPFPAARAEALNGLLPPEAAGCLSSPNNILGIEYLKAIRKLHSQIRPYSIPRIANGYHQETLSSHKGISSATAIRQEMQKGNTPLLSSHMPAPAFALLLQELSRRGMAVSEDFSLLLHYLLLQTDTKRMASYLDIGPDLADRICSLRKSYTGLEQFVSLLKTRQLTETRIRRALFHLLLSIRTDDITDTIQRGWHSYIRILGFRRHSASLLRQIKANSPLPIISKLADAKNQLSPLAWQMLQRDIRASEIYESAVTHKYTCGPYSEYTQQLVIL